MANSQSVEKKVVLEMERSQDDTEESICDDTIAAEGEHRGDPEQDEDVEVRANFWSGCLGPVMMLFGRKPAKLDPKRGVLEIDYDDVKDGLRFVGSGGQGAVYEGVYRGERVAVKKVREKSDTDIGHLFRLRHDNIVQFRGVCSAGPTYCIVMEYCPEGSLYDQLRKRKEILPPEVMEWARQIASGMQFLHSKKIIHRDLKSANILVTEKDSLKISDFGTCKQIGDCSTPMTMIGTVAWMSPEMIRGELCSEKVDIWSYGVLVWELLTRQRPYDNFDHSAIIYGVGSGSLNLPVPASCPSGLKHLMQICWSPKPTGRPSFRHIRMHLDIAAGEFITIEPEWYLNSQQTWQTEITEVLRLLRPKVCNIPNTSELTKQKEEELKEVKVIKNDLQLKVQSVNRLYQDLVRQKEELDRTKEQMKGRRTSRKKMSPSVPFTGISGSNPGLCDDSSSNEDEIFHPVGVSQPYPCRKRQKKPSQSSSLNGEGVMGQLSRENTPILSERPDHLTFKENSGAGGGGNGASVEIRRDDEKDRLSAVSPGGTISPAVSHFLLALRSKSTPGIQYNSLRRPRRRGHVRNWSGGSVKAFDYAVTGMKGLVAVSDQHNLLPGHSSTAARLQRSCSGLIHSERSPFPRRLSFSKGNQEEEEEQRESRVRLSSHRLIRRESSLEISGMQPTSSSSQESDNQEGCDADESSADSEPEDRRRSRSSSVRLSPIIRGPTTTSLSEVQLLRTFYDKSSLPPQSQQLHPHKMNNDSGFQTPTGGDHNTSHDLHSPS